MTYDEKTQAAMDAPYTSSNGKESKLGDLPLPYLQNIKAKLERQHANTGDATVGVPLSTIALYADVCTVVDVKTAEAEAATEGESK